MEKIKYTQTDDVVWQNVKQTAHKDGMQILTTLLKLSINEVVMATIL